MRFDKKGSSDWTVGKLITIVLAVFVLIVLIFAVSGGIIPSIEKIEGKFIEISGLLKFWEKGDNLCYKDEIASYSDGEELLKNLGLEGQGIIIERCDGVCNISGGGLIPYKISRGEFKSFSSGEWRTEGNLIKGDITEARRNWELYNKGINLLEEKDLRDLFKSGVSKVFSLTSDGNGLSDKPTRASWQNGVWNVSVDGGVGELFTDDNAAIDRFNKGVNDYSPDKVTWKFVEKNTGVDEWSGSGRDIDDLIFNFGRIYDSISAAEHRGNYNKHVLDFRSGYSPWIRTKYGGGFGSSAYGPVQLTKGLAQGYLNNNNIFWDENEREYLRRFIAQGDLFLKWGGKDMPLDKIDPSTGENVSRYDYGGSGDLNGLADRIMYRQVCEKMLGEIFLRRRGNIDDTWREWRFGPKDMKLKDVDYEDAFYYTWSNHPSRADWDFGDFGEIDTKGDVIRLKRAFAKLKEESSLRTKFSDNKLKLLKSSLLPDKIDVNGVEFEVGVESDSKGVIVSIFNDKDKFGLRQIGGAKGRSKMKFFINDKLKTVELRYFPVSLVEWNDGSWIEIGSEDYYRLYANYFKEVLRASFIYKFLNRRCQ